MSMMLLPSFLALDVKGACRRIWGALFGQDIQNLREEKRRPSRRPPGGPA